MESLPKYDNKQCGNTMQPYDTNLTTMGQQTKIPFSSLKESLVKPKGITGPTLSTQPEYTFTQTNAHIGRSQCPLKQ